MEGDQGGRNIVVIDIDTDMDRFIIRLFILLCAQSLLPAHQDNHTCLQEMTAGSSSLALLLVITLGVPDVILASG